MHPALLIPLLLPAQVAQEPSPTAKPVELGAVEWMRDLDAGLQRANDVNKPAFLLFQEIPGCDTCQNFGRGPLTLPLMVEAIQTEFVPIAVYNNKKGKDADWLDRFSEPSWNNPVVRFVDHKGVDLIERRDGVWGTHGIASRMVKALEAAGRRVPLYLGFLVWELDSVKHQKATFAMHCFWEGEAKLGALTGVLETRAGWVGDKEVVEVTYDPSLTPYAELLRNALKMECASTVYTVGEEQQNVASKIASDRAEPLAKPARDTKVSDRKYYLANSHLRFVPLTPGQAVKVNADLGLGENGYRYLSPEQRALAAKIAKALEHDAKAFEGLQRPSGFEELASYDRELRLRLKRVES